MLDGRVRKRHIRMKLKERLLMGLLGFSLALLIVLIMESHNLVIVGIHGVVIQK